jgi:hypothetical protein
MVPSTGQIIFSEKKELRSSEQHKLDDLVEKNSEPLVKVSTIIPFTLFPTDVIIDISKITIITREFFSSESILSILIQNIEEIMVETSPFFATVKILTKGFHDNPIEISYLSKRDALAVQKTIQGLANEIDLKKVNPQEILGEIAQLGQIETEEISVQKQ